MAPKLTNEELNEIWDDESGVPPPMTDAEMDDRLRKSTDLLREEIRAQEAQNAQLSELVTRYSNLLSELKAEAEQTNFDGRHPSLEIRRLRDTLLRLAKSSVAVARTL